MSKGRLNKNILHIFRTHLLCLDSNIFNITAGLWAISTFHRVKYQTQIHLFTVCANQISVSANRTKFLRKMKHFESNFLIDYDCNFQVDFSALVVMAHQISKLIRAVIYALSFYIHKLSLSPFIFQFLWSFIQIIYVWSSCIS